MSEYIHKEYPKTVGKKEFWKQVKRTVNGVEVSENDILQIVGQVEAALELTNQDHLLDLGCGNGALASYLFHNINRYTGVDFSAYLIEIAVENFIPHAGIEYIESDILKYINRIDCDHGYNKILIYGVMSYLSCEDFKLLLENIKEKLDSVQKIFIGNIPNRANAEKFYAARDVRDYKLDDPRSSIGVWWSEKEIVQISRMIGYNAKILKMPDSFYAASYRFDLLLT